MAQPFLSTVNHGRQCQVWTDFWCPPGLQCNPGVEPQLVQPALQPHRWGAAQLLLGLSTAVAIEAIERPIAIGRQIHFPITLLSGGSDECLEAGGGPELIFALPLLGPILQPSRQFQNADALGRASQNPIAEFQPCLLYTSPSPRDGLLTRMPSSA